MTHPVRLAEQIANAQFWVHDADEALAFDPAQG